jgi:hypothetical protein
MFLCQHLFMHCSFYDRLKHPFLPQNYLTFFVNQLLSRWLALKNQKNDKYCRSRRKMIAMVTCGLIEASLAPFQQTNSIFFDSNIPYACTLLLLHIRSDYYWKIRYLGLLICLKCLGLSERNKFNRFQNISSYSSKFLSFFCKNHLRYL